MAWTDDPLVTVHHIKTIHIEEIRDRVETLQAVACPADDGVYDSAFHQGDDATHDQAVQNTARGAVYSGHFSGADQCDDGTVQAAEDSSVQTGVQAGDDATNYSSVCSSHDATEDCVQYNNDDRWNQINDDAVNYGTDDGADYTGDNSTQRTSVDSGADAGYYVNHNGTVRSSACPTAFSGQNYAADNGEDLSVDSLDNGTHYGGYYFLANSPL